MISLSQVELVQQEQQYLIEAEFASLFQLVNGWDAAFRRKRLLASCSEEDQTNNTDDAILVRIQQFQCNLVAFLERLQTQVTQTQFLSIQTNDTIKQYFEHYRSIINNQIQCHEQQYLPQTKIYPPAARGSKFSHQVSHCLKRWFYNHLSYPYPTKQETQELITKTGLTHRQIQIWFINSRGRVKTKGFARKNFKSIVKHSYLMLRRPNEHTDQIQGQKIGTILCS